MGTNRRPSTQRLIDELGGVTAAAKKLGVSGPAVSKWTTPPARHHQRIRELTGRDVRDFETGEKPDGDHT
jgi:predicted transcriptional regulator